VSVETADPVVHLCPPDGSTWTGCCRKTPFELGRLSQLTLDAALVTCPSFDREHDGALFVRRGLLEDLVDDEPCWFDHHGGCQGHGYLSLQHGETCPQAELKTLLGLPT
jgi:hypothetical protein